MQVSKILVVDDEPEVRKLMEHFLTDRGYQVRLAANGREGLAAIDSFAPDVVLLDMHMPEMDGLETLKELAVRAPGLPVIMVTVNEDVSPSRKRMLPGSNRSGRSLKTSTRTVPRRPWMPRTSPTTRRSGASALAGAVRRSPARSAHPRGRT